MPALKKVELVWLQNMYAHLVPLQGLEVAFQKGYMMRYYDNTRIEVGAPQATSEMSVEALEARGIVGLYGYRFIHPYDNYKKDGALAKVNRKEQKCT